MGVGAVDLRTLKEAIVVGRRNRVCGGKQWRSCEHKNVTRCG